MVFCDADCAHLKVVEDVCVPASRKRTFIDYIFSVLHHSNIRYAITNLEMPAMSPTMTEGEISSWKKREGEAFSTGDVLLEIVRVLLEKVKVIEHMVTLVLYISGN